jgi:hypothetical protein
MEFVLLTCLLSIWAYALYGFITDDLGIGLFGRLFSALCYGAIATLVLSAFGGLCFVTALAIREIL